MIDGSFDQRLCCRIEPGRRLVEHHNARVFQEDPGERQKLGLAGRQSSVPRVEEGVETIRHRREPRVEFEAMDRVRPVVAPVERVVGEIDLGIDRLNQMLAALGHEPVRNPAAARFDAFTRAAERNSTRDSSPARPTTSPTT